MLELDKVNTAAFRDAGAHIAHENFVYKMPGNAQHRNAWLNTRNLRH